MTQWGNVGGLVAGFALGDVALIGRSMHDVVAEPYRKGFIPGYDQLKEGVLAEGALAMNIAGSGPSIFALAADEAVARWSRSGCGRISPAPVSAARYMRAACRTAGQGLWNSIKRQTDEILQHERQSMRTRLFASRGRAGGAGTRRRVVRSGTYPAGRYGRRGAAGRGVLCRAGRIPGGTFFGDDIDPGLLRREMERIYDFPLPLRRVGSRYTLELFHGPTFAFKDYGAGFMGRMIGLMGGAGEKLVILTATSGDTGSAVAHGFYGVPGVEVVSPIPKGRSAGRRSAR